MYIILIWAMLLLCWQPAVAQEARTGVGAIPYHFNSGNTTNSTNVKNSEGTIYSIIAINTNTTLYYLKLYDTSGAPVCNVTPVVHTIAIPYGSSGAGGGFVLPLPTGLQFYNGIGFCITGGQSDTDNTNASTGITLSISYR